MRILFRHFLVLFVLFSGSAFAAQLVHVPTMGPTGIRTFSAKAEAPGETVQWSVDRVTKNDSDGARESIKLAVYKSTGAEATFKLDKVPGKQTIWRIHAKDSVKEDVQDVQVFPVGKMSSFTFDSPGNPLTRVFVILPTTLNANSKLMSIHHGQGRDTAYCGYWREWAEVHDTLLICPRFTERDWPDSLYYARGFVFADEASTQLNPESRWAYTVVEQVQKYSRTGFGIKDPYVDMWGHSAGGQFVQRFTALKPNVKVRLAMMANPGWYMLPSMTTDYPCGMRHPQLGITQEAVMKYSQRNSILFRGTKDTDPKEPESGGCMDAQGLGRYARAGTFFATMQAFNPLTTWKMVDVLNVPHDGEKMARATQAYLDEQARQGQH